MIKIPTSDIIARSYRFAFAGFFKVLGIVWLPLALGFAAAFLVLVPLFSTFGQLLAHLPSVGENELPPEFSQSMAQMYRYAILLMLVALFLRAVMMLGITREALGLNKGPSFVFFAIGKDAWRLFGAYFILQILIQIAAFVVIIVVAIPAVIIGIVAALIINVSHLPPAVISVLTIVGVVAAMSLVYGAIIYFAIRLGFLLTPVVVVEKTIAIERIWNLSKGNVWRLFFIGLAITLPFIFVYALLMIAIFVHAWPALASMPHDGHVPAAVVSAHLQAFFEMVKAAWVVFVPVAVIFATLLFGLVGSASAFAYRALVPLPTPGAAPAA